MQAKDDWVVIGRFGRPHGIKGLVNLYSFTDPIENIFDYQPLHIQLKKSWCPIKILSSENKGGKLFVQVENYPSREDVALLTNLDVAVPRRMLPALDENVFYLHDLIHLSVINLEQKVLGQVIEIINTGANDILVIINGQEKIMIPLIWDIYIKTVDLEQQTICVDWTLDDLPS